MQKDLIEKKYDNQEAIIGSMKSHAVRLGLDTRSARACTTRASASPSRAEYNGVGLLALSRARRCGDARWVARRR
jgi:hypothetical protein